MPTCATCQKPFEVSAATQSRFPGWTPSDCADCYRKNRRGSGSSGSGSPRSGSGRGGGRGRRGRSATVEENLTVAEVLEKYTAGPVDGVFTDGSATPNPGPGGWGAVWVVDGEMRASDHGHDPDTTNNRMELQAIAAGLDLVPAGTPVTIHTDSRLAVDTLTRWAAGWKAKGWSRKGGPIKNLDLITPLYERLLERPEVSIEWIAAHSGNRWNEVADSLSTAWMRDEI